MHQQNPNLGASDKNQSLVYMLSGVLFVLVLLEKSLTSPQVPQSHKIKPSPVPVVEEENLRFLTEKAKERLGLKNVGKDEIPTIDRPFPLTSQDREIEQLRNEALQELEELPDIGNSTWQDPYVSIYFIKFFGKDTKATSRLVKVSRTLPPGRDPVLFVLEELKKGPRPDEKTRGVLNSLPDTFTYSKDYRIQDGILYLDLGSSIEYGGGPQVLRDRLDQISYSLIGVAGIKGIWITIERRKVSFLGGDGVPLPEVLEKTERKITTL